ncbi:MAG: hypothetical protein ABL971_01450 [Vicinamibacterales bacterium]
MHLLLLLNSPLSLRPFVDTVRTLAERGHRVTIGWPPKSARGHDTAPAALASTEGVQFADVPSTRDERRVEVGLLRRTRTYVRYLDPPFHSASKLRRRAFSRLLRAALTDSSPIDPALADTPVALPRRDIKRLAETLDWLESLVPPDPASIALLRDGGYDAVLVSPLVDLSSSGQADVVKAARHVGIPAGLLVYSWDNLSTKGSLHVMPDTVFTWNQVQRDEAVKLHGVPAAQVVVTGAPRFDTFLGRAPIFARHQFLTALALDPSKPVLMYVCSSAFVSGDESVFIRRWIAALRNSPSADVRSCGVIIRPHPDIALTGMNVPGHKLDFAFDGVPVTTRRPFDDPHVVVVSTTSVTPQGLYECLSHSDAVVGLNTSAEIEAGLLGRPVFSVLAGDYADGQQTTLHFHYLLREQGGFVEAAGSFEQHIEQLHALLSLTPKQRLRHARGVTRRAMKFVRPLGADVPVAGLLADAIEREMLARPRPVAGDAAARPPIRRVPQA